MIWTPEQIEDIKALRLRGVKQREIAAKYSCGRGSIERVCKTHNIGFMGGPLRTMPPRGASKLSQNLPMMYEPPYRADETLTFWEVEYFYAGRKYDDEPEASRPEARVHMPISGYVHCGTATSDCSERG